MGAALRPVSVAVLLSALALFLPAQQTAGKRDFSYEQVFGTEPETGGDQVSLLGKLPRISGWLDGSTYLETRDGSADGQNQVFAVNAADGSARLFRDYAEIQKSLPDGFKIEDIDATTPDLTRAVLIRDDDLYYLDLVSKSFRRMTTSPGQERNPLFSPDGRWVAYTRDNNLFAYDLEDGVEHQYTTDGSASIYNGWASWVYYEEIIGRPSRFKTFWWSPDSSRIVFMRFDDSPVPKFPIYHAEGQHGELEIQHYPKAGDPNPYVAMAVVSVSSGKIVWMDFQPKADHYIAWPFWTKDSRTLTVQWMNRNQDTIRIFNCDPTSGAKSTIHEEHQASWVSFFEDLYHFDNGSGFILRSDIDGWSHLYYYDNKGALQNRLTTGPWPVESLDYVDEAGGYVYFTARPGKPWDYHLMRVKLDGTGLQRLTGGEGTHRALISPGAAYFIDTFSTITSPAVMNLYRGDGTFVRSLGNAKTAAMDQYRWGKAELFTIPTADGYDLPAYWILPVDFNPGRTYPVIFTIYGGPDAGTVRNSWPGLQPHYWAQRGVITISVDHRGGGAFGKKGVAMMYKSLGKWEMADLITAAEWLRAKPFIAKDKIGITGSSYGGYITMMALTFGADHFNYGLAGSAVTDWQLYDSIYTERYMGTPSENPEGYKNGSVLTWIDRYKGFLRITHGTTDDNVHMQNSIQVVNWLTSNNRRFELMLYPDSRHAIRQGQRPHLLRESHDFWMRNLLGVKAEPQSSEGSGAAEPQ